MTSTEQNLDTLRNKWRQLQTARVDVRARLLAQAEAEVSGMRDEFNALVWSTVRRDKVRIQQVSDRAGISRAQVHKILKDYENANPELRLSGGGYTFTNPAGNKHLIHGATWVQGLKFENGLGKLTGIEVGLEEDFRRELDDESTGLRERIATYVNNLRANDAEQGDGREDLGDD